MRAVTTITLFSLLLAGCQSQSYPYLMPGRGNDVFVIHDRDDWAAQESRERQIARSWAAAYCAQKGKTSRPYGVTYNGSYVRSGFSCWSDELLAWKRADEEKRKDPQKYFKAQCSEIGFTEGTESFGDCVLRLMEMEQAQGSTASVASPTVTPTRADTLQGLAEMLNGVQTMVNPATSAPPRSTQGSFCPKASESVFGAFKTCVYRCPGGQVSESIGATELCPLSIRR